MVGATSPLLGATCPLLGATSPLVSDLRMLVYGACTAPKLLFSVPHAARPLHDSAARGHARCARADESIFWGHAGDARSSKPLLGATPGAPAPTNPIFLGATPGTPAPRIRCPRPRPARPRRRSRFFRGHARHARSSNPLPGARPACPRRRSQIFRATPGTRAPRIRCPGPRPTRARRRIRFSVVTT